MGSSKRVVNLLFVRHGQTAKNPLNILQGSHNPETPLSPQGIQQAKLLGQHLSDINFDRVLTSDYARAIQTTKLILDQAKTCQTPETRIDARLRERDYGEAEGQPLSNFLNEARRRNVEHFFLTPDGAESYSQVTARVESVFKDLCCVPNNVRENQPSTSTLIVTHGGFLLFLMKYFHSQEDLKRLELENFDRTVAFEMSENTGVTNIELQPQENPSRPRTVVFRTIADSSHLSSV